MKSLAPKNICQLWQRRIPADGRTSGGEIGAVDLDMGNFTGVSGANDTSQFHPVMSLHQGARA